MNPEQRETFRRQCVEMFSRTGTVLRDDEISQIELADFGLGHFEVEGLGLVVYENNPRYCAKELVMLPRQTCPQHRHPPHDSDPGKMETFRCRWGKVFLYVEGTPASSPAARPPAGKEKFYTVWKEIAPNPGDQYTIPPNTWHWFQSGDEGAVVSEFSSTSRDDLDIFTDPKLVRVSG